MSLSGHKGFRKSTFLKCSNWALRGQRLSLKMFQLSWKLMGMILTIFWTSLRYLGIDSRALRGTIGRLFSFLWLYNQPFYMPPNLPRALRKGAVSSSFFFLSSFSQFDSSSTCLVRFRPNLARMTSRWLATKVINSLTSKVMQGSQRSKRSILWKMLLLLHALLDFDKPWSKWPTGMWLQKLSTVWPQRSCRGHRGQKR